MCNFESINDSDKHSTYMSIAFLDCKSLCLTLSFKIAVPVPVCYAQGFQIIGRVTKCCFASIVFVSLSWQ